MGEAKNSFICLIKLPTPNKMHGYAN